MRSPDNVTPVVNVKSVVAHFGGGANLARLAAGFEPPCTHEAIRKWVQRNRIPGWAIAVLTAIGEKHQRPLVISKHMAPPRKMAA